MVNVLLYGILYVIIYGCKGIVFFVYYGGGFSSFFKSVSLYRKIYVLLGNDCGIFVLCLLDVVCRLIIYVYF